MPPPQLQLARASHQDPPLVAAVASRLSANQKLFSAALAIGSYARPTVLWPCHRPGDLDVYDGAGTGQTGRCKIVWKAVDCPVGTHNIHYHFEGSK